jgi:hypothetical protein
MSPIAGVATGVSIGKLANMTGLSEAAISTGVAELEQCKELYCDWANELLYTPRMLLDCQPRGVREFRAWSGVWPLVRRSSLHNLILAEVSYLLERQGSHMLALFHEATRKTEVEFEGILPPEIREKFAPKFCTNLPDESAANSGVAATSGKKGRPKKAESQARKTASSADFEAKIDPDESSNLPGQSSDSSDLACYEAMSEGLQPQSTAEIDAEIGGEVPGQIPNHRCSDALDSLNSLNKNQTKKRGEETRVREDSKREIERNPFCAGTTSAAEQATIRDIWAVYQRDMVGLVDAAELELSPGSVAKLKVLLVGKQEPERIKAAIGRIALNGADPGKRSFCHPAKCFEPGVIAFALKRIDDDAAKVQRISSGSNPVAGNSVANGYDPRRGNDISPEYRRPSRISEIVVKA